jgi:hypothetical protein
MDSVRIDKWLWAARFFKTRALASKACDLGRILSNGHEAKPSREVRVGDMLQVKNEGGEFQDRGSGVEPDARPGGGGADALSRERSQQGGAPQGWPPSARPCSSSRPCPSAAPPSATAAASSSSAAERMVGGNLQLRVIGRRVGKAGVADVVNLSVERQRTEQDAGKNCARKMRAHFLST